MPEGPVYIEIQVRYRPTGEVPNIREIKQWLEVELLDREMAEEDLEVHVRKVQST